MGSYGDLDGYRYDAPGGPLHVPDAGLLLCAECRSTQWTESIRDPWGDPERLCGSCALERARRYLHRRPLLDDYAARDARILLRSYAQRRIAVWRRGQEGRSRRLVAALRDIGGI
jgi:hypothetical protein